MVDPIGYLTTASWIFDLFRSRRSSGVFSCDPGRRGDGLQFPRARSRRACFAMRPTYPKVGRRPPFFFLFLRFFFFFGFFGGRFPSPCLPSSLEILVQGVPHPHLHLHPRGCGAEGGKQRRASAGPTWVDRVLLGTAVVWKRKAMNRSNGRIHEERCQGVPACHHHIPLVTQQDAPPSPDTPSTGCRTHRGRERNQGRIFSKGEDAPRPPSILSGT